MKKLFPATWLSSRNYKHIQIVITLFMVTLSACLPGEYREELTLQQLLNTTSSPSEPVLNKYFLPVGKNAAALHEFSGAIVIPEHSMISDPKEILPTDINGKEPQLFPGVELEFISNGEYLIPLERDIIIPSDSDSYWQIQVSPGRVWSESGDGNLSRASFPFLLTSIIENESYNGVATFLYNENSLSSIRYQIVSHLSPFVIKKGFFATGQTKVSYKPISYINSDVVKDFKNEITSKLPWRDWEELEQIYGKDLFINFDSGIEQTLTLTSGLIIDGTVYVRSMDTPFGPYPYPHEMRHGVWSVTKSAAGLLTLMRMARKYGYEILDYRINDYLDINAKHDGWENVTFRNVFSMATGIGTGTHNITPNIIGVGDASRPQNNAGFDEYMDWYFAPTLEEKLDEVFKVPNYPWGPGEHARYRDRDIFVGSAALESLLREKEGDDADLWQMMVDEVYQPIGIQHISMTHTREKNERGTPMMAWGIYVSIDDIAKISMLIQNGGMHNGIQLLSQEGISEALYETKIRGLPTGESNIHGAKSYHLTLWHENFKTQDGRVYNAPRMSGYGGNIVQLMPNGIIGFRIGNGGDKKLEQMTIIADQIRSFDEHRRNKITGKMK